MGWGDVAGYLVGAGGVRLDLLLGGYYAACVHQALSALHVSAMRQETPEGRKLLNGLDRLQMALLAPKQYE